MTGMERIASGARKESDWRVKKEKETAGRASSKDGAGEAAAARSGSVEEPNMDEWPQTLFECAAQVKKSYPGIHFSLESFIDRDGIDDLAKFYGVGVHLAIAPEFLQGMISSPEAFGDGMDVLQKLVKQMHSMAKQVATDGKSVIGMGAAVKEDGTASIWTLAQEQQKLPSFFTEQKKQKAEELMSVRHYQEKGGRNVTEIKSMDGTTIRFVFTKRINYSASGDVGRLARFSEVGSVHSFIGGLRAYMNQISHDPYLDKSEVQNAIAQMKGVLRRADRKVQDLNSEDALESVRRRALENEKRKKAAEIADELKRRRLERRLREYAGSGVRGPKPDITTDLSYEVEQRREEAKIEAEMAAPDTVDAAFVEAAAAAEMAAVASAAAPESGGETAAAEVAVAVVDVRV